LSETSIPAVLPTVCTGASFPRGRMCQGPKLTTHLFLVLSLKSLYRDTFADDIAGVDFITGMFSFCMQAFVF